MIAGWELRRAYAIHWLVTTEQPGMDHRMACILGVSVSDMVGQNSFTYVYPEDQERASEVVRS
jgi:hypothetical protein